MTNHFLNVDLNALARNAIDENGVNSDDKAAQEANVSLFSTAEMPDEYTRYSGGHKRFITPYISGYWYFLVCPPKSIFPSGDELNTFTNKAVSRLLHSCAESFTPPSKTLKKEDLNGMGGVSGSSYVVGQEITRTFSVTFREYQNLPINKVFKKWVSYFDPTFGVISQGSYRYIPAAYKGWAVAFLCKPTVSKGGRKLIAPVDVEEAFIFDGVWPEGEYADTFSTDIGSNESQTLNVTWNYDGTYFGIHSFDGKPFRKAMEVFNSLISKGIDETYVHNKNITG